MNIFFKNRNKIAFSIFFVILLANVFLWYTSAIPNTHSVPRMPEPKLTHYINDYTGLLNPETIKRIDAQLLDFDRNDNIQLVVVILPSLNGYPIEKVAHHLFSTNQIGHKNLDSGALLLIAKEDRKLRIEVGRGLESSLTDALSGRILDTVLAPALREGRYEDGIFETLKAIMSSLKGQFDNTSLDISIKHHHAHDDVKIFLIGWFVALIADLKENAFYRESAQTGSHRSRDTWLGHTPFIRLLAAIFLIIYFSYLYATPVAQLLALLTGFALNPVWGLCFIACIILFLAVLLKPFWDYIADQVDLDGYVFRGTRAFRSSAFSSSSGGASFRSGGGRSAGGGSSCGF